jgi:hypothetical protein
MRESEIEKLCTDYLCHYPSIEYWKFKVSGQIHSRAGRTFRKKSNTPGWPDLVIIHNSKFIGIELKAIDGRQSDVQKLCQAKIVRGGGLYYIIRSINEFKLLISEIIT